LNRASVDPGQIFKVGQNVQAYWKDVEGKGNDKLYKGKIIDYNEDFE